MKLDRAAEKTLRALRRANGASFTDLVNIAGLDPARDFRDADLSEIDFAGSDLDGYDFSGAKLSNASFVGAQNYARANFTRAELGGVTWPGSWRPKQDKHLRPASPHLNRIQQSILESLLKTLTRHRSGRAVAMLPPGIGKSQILAEIFRHLNRTKAFLRGMILCETVAEREQLIHILNDRTVITANNEQAHNRHTIPRGETLVETYGNYGRMQNELKFGAMEEGNPFKCTHVALTSLPSRRRSAITRMADAEDAPAMLAFIDALAVRSSTKDLQSKLTTVFKSITYQYEVDQAVIDGLLVESELIDRSNTTTEYVERHGTFDERASALIEEVASDFDMKMSRVSQPLKALLIVPDGANTTLLANKLDLQLLHNSKGIGTPPKIVVLTARGPSGDWVLPPPHGVVVISKQAVADGVDLRSFGLVGVLTRLSERLSTKLMFTPARPVEAGRVRVLDYDGSLSEIIRNYDRAL